MKARDAFADIVRENGVAAVAERLGWNQAVLQNKANPRNESNCPTLADCEKVTLYYGDSRIADAFCQLAGGIFVKLGNFEGTSDSALLEIVTRLGHEQGEIFGALNDGLADGVVTQKEYDRVEAHVYKHNQASAEMLNRLKQFVKQAPSISPLKAV